MGIIGVWLLGVVLGILGVAFFAVLEISLAGSDKLAFLEQRDRGQTGAGILLQLLADPQRISHALLAGSVLSAGASALFFSLLMQGLLPEGTATLRLLLLFGLFVPLLTLFGEILPRILFYPRAEETALRLAGPLALTLRVLRPLVHLSLTLHALVQARGRKRGGEKNPFVQEEDLEWIRCFAEGTETLRKEELRIIRKIVDFNEIRVRDILVPMEHVVAVRAEAPAAEAMRRIVESGFTRLPVYAGDPGRIVGLLHARDLFRLPALDRKVAECDRRPYFVTPETLVPDLFKSMQRRGVMMAVAAAADGKAQGIVTMEDILEEIFGEIEDEYDLKDRPFREIGGREYLVDGGADVKELNRHLHLGIPSDGYRTLSGYILHHLQRIPQEGERFTIGNLLFKIELADETRIYKLFLRLLQSR